MNEIPPAPASRPSDQGPAAPARRRQEARHAAARARIIAAAKIEFALQGFAGARVDAIAARADINKRMLYAYVGNKEALWLAVLEDAYRAMRIEEQALDVQRLPPVQGMERLVRFNFRYHAEHPEFLALLNNENLQQGRHLRQSAQIRDMYSPLLNLIGDLLRRGAEEGAFRSGIDPAQLYISIAALSYFYCSNQYTLSAIFGRDLMAPDELAAREAHVIDVVLGYLRL